ncbi:E3 ubiquitin-protein ligase RNF43 [Plecturocebus cupreus]
MFFSPPRYLQELYFMMPVTLWSMSSILESSGEGWTLGEGGKASRTEPSVAAICPFSGKASIFCSGGAAAFGHPTTPDSPPQSSEKLVSSANPWSLLCGLTLVDPSSPPFVPAPVSCQPPRQDPVLPSLSCQTLPPTVFLSLMPGLCSLTHWAQAHKVLDRTCHILRADGLSWLYLHGVISGTRSHPLYLCNASDDDNLEPGFISIVKLESPRRAPRPCLSLASKARVGPGSCSRDVKTKAWESQFCDYWGDFSCPLAKSSNRRSPVGFPYQGFRFPWYFSRTLARRVLKIGKSLPAWRSLDGVDFLGGSE